MAKQKMSEEALVECKLMLAFLRHDGCIINLFNQLKKSSLKNRLP